jgi:hypothetical protein
MKTPGETSKEFGERLAQLISVEPVLESSEVMLRVGVFVVVAMLCRFLLPALINLFPLPESSALLVRSVLTSFGAGAIASYVCALVFADGRLDDFGLGWMRRTDKGTGSVQQFSAGLAAGSIAAACVIVIPILLGWASLVRVESAAAAGFSFTAILFGILMLLLGAAGEELLFHGYAFQLLLGQRGQLPPSRLKRYSGWVVVIVVALIFGAAHVVSNGAPMLAAFNTAAWGFLLGFACWRTGALWLSIGLHFGWNVVFPLFGVNLSGITIGVSSAVLEWKVGDLWSGGTYGPEGGLLTTGSVLLVFLFLWRVRWQPDLQSQ